MGLSAAQPKPTTAPQYRGSLCSWGGLCGSPLPFPGAFSPGTAMETEAPPRAPLTGTAACPLPPALLTPCLGTMPDLPLHLALSPTGQLSSIPEPKPRSRPLPGIRTHGCPAPAPAVAPAHVSSVLSGLPRAARASSPPSLPCPPPGPPLSQLRLPCPTTRPWPVLTMLHACPSLSWEEQPQLCSQLAWNSSVPREKAPGQMPPSPGHSEVQHAAIQSPPPAGQGFLPRLASPPPPGSHSLHSHAGQQICQGRVEAESPCHLHRTAGTWGSRGQEHRAAAQDCAARI